ncbi:MAG: phosphomannomutase/phosphoglucomutase [Candidatus Sabulitectum sp.]|nr:phosphomannomutase/phosphoglucomutase [Candidatus Sabulitectum sp.]
MNREIFRKYDIRGVAGRDLDNDTVSKLGFVLGVMADSGVLAIGRDCRTSGIRLRDQLARGAARAGCAVVDLGEQTTPMTYFAAYTMKPAITVMITGSHNPAEYNGFKIMKGLHTLWGDAIAEIQARVETAKEIPNEIPQMQKVSVREAYMDRLRSEFAPPVSLKVAVDAGNGTGGDCAVDLLKQLGHRVVPLFCNADGTFPNHHPDPTVISNLKDLSETVVKEKCDLGIAFDGDADRIGIVDEKGQMIFGDRILCVLAEALLAENPEATIISEVKASSVFFTHVEAMGGRALMLPTGHSIIKEGMLKENALLAGEMSGHIFFRDRYYGYDDALYAALRFLEIAEKAEGPVSSLTSKLSPVMATPEIREECDDSVKFKIVEKVKQILSDQHYTVNDIDGVRVEFNNGWGLLRASNTQPVLVMRFEAETIDQLKEYEHKMRTILQKAREEL